MIHSDSFDAAVLGSGIAGLSIADALSRRGQQCVVLDAHAPGSGASSAPFLLANPAAGRRAKKTWKAEECLICMEDFLNRVQTRSKTILFEKNGLLRPALTEQIADDFKKSPEKYNWPAGWLSWIPKKPFADAYPYFGKHFGGLKTEHAFTIRGPEFLDAAISYLESEGVTFLFSKTYSLIYSSERWDIEFKDQQKISAGYLVDATGYGQLSSNFWEFLPLHPIKGQTLTLQFENPLPLVHSVSSLGYMAFMNSSPEFLTVGSTYEHNFDHLNPDQAGLEHLCKKTEATFPGMFKRSIASKQWANVRVTVPDKQPVAGAHPEFKNLYMLGALGSKGMLTGRFLAECLATHILDGSRLESTISINRFRN